VAALTVLAQLSDPHVEVGTGDDGSSDALAAAVRAVLRLAPLPEAVLVSGDVTNDGDAPSYARAREVLAALPMPVHVLPGNHDDRAALRAAFGPGAGPEPYRWAVAYGGLRLVGCDTTVPGAPGGAFDAEARAWLSDTLAEDRSTPTIVALHHPPMRIGIAALDDIRVPAADAAALAAVLARSPQVRRVVCGHVHRGAVGALGGLPVFACPSVFLQARLDLAGGEIDLIPGAPAIGVHVLLDDGEVVSHVHPVG
jgi:3',5'-cyclic AMP phosphodiesterase CpdA